MEGINTYTHRYIARVVLEAETPLFVSSGESSLLTDALVQKDIHGFPMISGTSLTGVLRHSLEDFSGDNDKWKEFFGYQVPRGKKGKGSQIKISSAYLILEDGKVAEGLNPGFDISKYKLYFENLPVRPHVRITHKGVADTKNKGLFDNEVMYKGVRFLFEVELKGNGEEELWDEFLNELNSPLFRVGQGTRKGYGKLKVESINSKVFDLSKDQDFNDYLNFNPSLNAANNLIKRDKFVNDKNLIRYQLKLKPESFFSFSGGFGDQEVDSVPATEDIIKYENGKLTIKKDLTLISASSIKGSLSHRTAFHYNKFKGYFVDNYSEPKFKEFIETYNDAVYELFGAELGHENGDGMRGKVILNDVLIEDAKNDKIFNHVAIDRFTGGAMDGALFSEKVSYFEDKNKEIELDVWVESDVKESYLNAFEEALKDVCKGLLPLGGMTTKGHGIFTGKLLKNEKEVFKYEN
ncbi:MAG: RAMP superfamily CRISPR-associated protein [Marinilabiliales bacterium]